MNTDYLAALGAFPPFLFVSDKMPYTELPYVIEIVNHAHAVFGSISFIQVIQPVAGKAVTVETEAGFSLTQLFTVLDSAHDAGF